MSTRKYSNLIETDEVIELYQKLTGQKLDMEIEEEKTEEGTEQPK